MYTSNEIFSIFDYAIALQNLVIRASSVGEDDHNIDIIFLGAFYLCLPTLFCGINISHASTKDVEMFASTITPTKNEKYFLIETGNTKYLIGALGFSVHLNNLDFDQTSLSAEPFERKQIYPAD
ncbi:MAG: hypothetical protein V4649_14815 [Bacteroidota bacterium]